ncbi:hypothetical protein H7C18_23070 [Cohnella sp. CBP 2801]|uniref:Uncharacterized protein n=1 Tax=Cohnella zeiphila TaxID=2761120 RepID=A0A7X0VXN9_9BACL|nr:hypothetical protein [Cohnella zeiphila]
MNATNRFVKPSPLSAIKLKRIELAMLESADRKGFEPLELSPAGPISAEHQAKRRKCFFIAEKDTLIRTASWTECTNI